MQLTFEEHPYMEVLDKHKMIMKVVSFKDAERIIVINHYTHKMGLASLCLGFFVDDWICGIITYGTPVGRRTIKSIDESLDNGSVFELTRLFAYDWMGKNTESRMIGLSIKYIKKNYPNIKCLISYSDPMENHLGKIYQATNWLYQGNETMLVQGYLHVIKGKTYHPRNVVSKYGTTKESVLYNIDSSYHKIRMANKHRYIYPLTQLKLKHPIKPYPKSVDGVTSSTSSNQDESGSAILTSTHN